MSSLYRLVAITWLVSVSYGATRFTVILFAISNGASSATAGMLSALFALFPAFLSISTGALIDRIGARQPMLWSAFLFSLIASLGWFGGRTEVLFFIAAAAGLVHNYWLIAHLQLVGAYSPPGERASGYTISALGFSAGAFVSPILAGAAVDSIGHAATLLGLAVFPLVSGTLVLRGALRFPIRSPASILRSDAPRESARTLIADPKLSLTYIISSVFESSWILFTFLIPILGTERGFSATTIGLVAGSMSLSTFGCRVFIPALLRRLAVWRMVIVALAITGLGYAGIAFADAVPAMIAFAIVIGAGQSMGAPIMSALLYENAPPGRSAQAIALRTAINYSIQVSLPILSGALGAVLGAASGFWMLSGLCFIGSWAARGRWRAHRR